MTPVSFKFVLPNGEPMVGSVEIQLSRSSYTEDVTGITMPRPITINTNEAGEGVLQLWPSDVPYILQVLDPNSEASIFYRFIVPEVEDGVTVRLQDLIDNIPLSFTQEVVQTVLVAQATVLAKAAEVEAAATATSAAAISAADAAVLAAFNAEAAAATAVELEATAAAQLEDVLDAVSTVATDAAAAAASATAAAASASAASTSASNANTAKVTAQSAATSATSSQTAAAASQTAAAGSATAAATSATSAVSNAIAASTYATAALGSKNAAATSATGAAGSATTATTQATNAATSATTALGAQAAAGSSATAAAASQTAAATSVTAASGSASAASTSASGAATSAAAALVSQNAAATSATGASTSAGTATTQASNAATSASAASTSASDAATSVSAASGSESAASGSASAAATSASAAATSQTAAATSASGAAASETAADAAATSADADAATATSAASAASTSATAAAASETAAAGSATAAASSETSASSSASSASTSAATATTQATSATASATAAAASEAAAAVSATSAATQASNASSSASDAAASETAAAASATAADASADAAAASETAAAASAADAIVAGVPVGGTTGQVLAKINGTNYNTEWTTPSTGGSGLTAIADDRILANISGSSAVPTATTLSDLLDSILGTTRGQIVTRGASAWNVLGPSTGSKVLTEHGSGADLTWETPSAGGGASGVNLQTGSGTYTLVLGDAAFNEVQRSNAAANNVTIPPNASVAFAVGTSIGIRMVGVGQTSVVAGSGVTINSLGNLNLMATGALAVAIQTATDVWWLTGELQPVVTYKSFQSMEPANTTTAGTLMGMVITSTATVSHPTQALTNLQTSLRRIRWATSTTAGTATGFFETIATKAQGSAGLGGYTCVFRFGISVNTTGHQVFVGLGPAAALAGDPSAVINMIGMGYDAADASTGNWQLMLNDASGTATRVDLGTGAARNTTSVYKLTLRAYTLVAGIYVTVVNEATGVVVLDTVYATDIPATTTYLAVRAQCRNGAIASAVQLDFAHYDAGMQE